MRLVRTQVDFDRLSSSLVTYACFESKNVPESVLVQLLYISAATTQQLGGPAPSTHMQFANKAAEDPALFVTFEEEDEDFPSTSHAAVARSQPMSFRRQAPQNAIGTQAANNRQQPPGGTVPQAPNRASSAGPVKTLSSAEQELEDLKRRIVDKEQQMKAKRQTGQGFSGVPARSRPNPAHGPVLRGLHRKQSPTDPAAVSTKEADLFLKQVAAELPASRGDHSSLHFSIWDDDVETCLHGRPVVLLGCFYVGLRSGMAA